MIKKVCNCIDKFLNVFEVDLFIAISIVENHYFRHRYYITKNDGYKERNTCG